MTSNFMLASYGWMRGWLYEVLVYGIDHSLKLNGSRDQKTIIYVFLTQCGRSGLWSFVWRSLNCLRAES